MEHFDYSQNPRRMNRNNISRRYSPLLQGTATAPDPRQATMLRRGDYRVHPRETMQRDYGREYNPSHNGGHYNRACNAAPNHSNSFKNFHEEFDHRQNNHQLMEGFQVSGPGDDPNGGYFTREYLEGKRKSSIQSEGNEQSSDGNELSPPHPSYSSNSSPCSSDSPLYPSYSSKLPPCLSNSPLYPSYSSKLPPYSSDLPPYPSYSSKSPPCSSYSSKSTPYSSYSSKSPHYSSNSPPYSSYSSNSSPYSFYSSNSSPYSSSGHTHVFANMEVTENKFTCNTVFSPSNVNLPSEESQEIFLKGIKECEQLRYDHSAFRSSYKLDEAVDDETIDVPE